MIGKTSPTAVVDIRRIQNNKAVQQQCTVRAGIS